MAFEKKYTDFMLLDVGQYGVNVVYDQHGNCSPLSGIGLNSQEIIKEARWLPNQQIEVKYGNRDGYGYTTVVRFTSLNEWYPAGIE